MTQSMAKNLEIRQKEKEMKSREEIAAKDRKSRERENQKNRNHEAYQNARNRHAGFINSLTGAAGRTAAAGLHVLANDPAFYKNYIKELDAFVNVPTFDRLGDSSKSPLFINTNIGDQFSGIQVFYWTPTIGSQYYGTPVRNAFNQSLLRTKEKILSKNSRSNVPWDAADLGYNLELSADMATLIMELRRVISAYDTYHARNAYLAKTLIEALGWTFSTVQDNIADMRKQYLRLAKKFNSSIVAPADMSLYARRIYLAENAFIDSGDGSYPRQIYVFVQGVYHFLDETVCPCASVNRNWPAYCTDIDTLINSVGDDFSFREMYEDLRHAFGENLIQLPETILDCKFTFNYDDRNREQIHNLESVPMINGHPSTLNLGGYALKQTNEGYIYQGKEISGGLIKGRSISIDFSEVPHLENEIIDDLCSRPKIFDMYKERPDGDDILDISRLAYTWDEGDRIGNVQDFTLVGCGTEFVSASRIYVFKHGYAAAQWITVSTDEYVESDRSTPVCDALMRMNFASHFDWSPIYKTTLFDYEEDVLSKVVYGDVMTTFYIAQKDLRDIHDACVMSEYYVMDTNFIR